jgi:hypothetical protein
MSKAQVHFEVFTRRRLASAWVLELACEDRTRAIDAAEEIFDSGHAIAVKVCKETLQAHNNVFHSVVVFAKGETKGLDKTKDKGAETPLCVSPPDLYTLHARDRIGRLLDGWLSRRSVTPFELLHRPDLAEVLDASGLDLQHAIQKIAVPEAQTRGVSTHEMIRTFQKLVERTIQRLVQDGKAKRFPALTLETFADVVTRLADAEGERCYILGGGVAAYLEAAATWSDKVERLLDLAQNAPSEGPARALALSVLEQPLAEIMGSRAGLADLLGRGLDLGGELAALTRLAAVEQVKLLFQYDPSLETVLPPLSVAGTRLASWMQRETFGAVRASLARRVLRELTGPRRLRPGDPEGEIAVLRALAMALTAASGPLLPLEDVQNAFIERSKALVAVDFVDTYLSNQPSVIAEAEALVRLAENVAGSVNKRAAARWLSACVGAMKFERELRFGSESPAMKLAALAALQRGVRRAGLAEADEEDICARIGEIGGAVEAEAKLTGMIARAGSPAPHRLTLLLRLAVGEAGPLGPAAERARAEAVKMLKAPSTRAELVAAPESLERVRSLLAQTGLAA